MYDVYVVEPEIQRLRSRSAAQANVTKRIKESTEWKISRKLATNPLATQI